MTNTYSPATEKRARDMYKDSRRGPQRYIEWNTLTESVKTDWLRQAKQIEDVIYEKLKAREIIE